MFTERTSVGLDVHARSVAAAAIDGVTGELVQAQADPVARAHPVLAPGPAGPGRGGLRGRPDRVRAVPVAERGRDPLRGRGALEAAAPRGDRVKTDAKDAVHLARLLRLDEFTAVAVPTVDQETARDLVRAREDARGDLMRARHRLSKLLLRQGIVYSGGQAWTGAHDVWLRRNGSTRPGGAADLRVRLRRGADREGPP